MLTPTGNGTDGVLALGPDTLLPDVLRTDPQARRVFDRHGLRGCGGRLGPYESVGFFARAHAVDERRLLRELVEAITAPAAPADAAPQRPAVADTLYRRFFTAGIVLILTAGATWGAWLLWQIGAAGRFAGASLHHVNAHGHAQIYGWVGLFIMGFAYQAFPRLWHTDLVAPRVAVATFIAMVVGLVVRTAGMTLSGSWSLALPAALAGGALEAAAVVTFATQILLTWRRSMTRFEPYVGFVFMALFWFVAQAALDLWHTYTTMTAATEGQLVWYVATYQAPLRDLQIHGLALFMILGVSLRKLPGIYGLPPVPAPRAGVALSLLSAAVAGEAVVFVAYRWTDNHAIAALLMVPWLMLAAGVTLIALPWKLWRPTPVADRTAKFVRAAYAWLFVSIAMLLLLPAYQALSGIPFSHAYYGATRHAITVGFISLMIMGVAAKVVPMLNGVDSRTLTSLWGPFVLVNVGCFLRVATQTLTDWDRRFFAIVGLSGTLEVIGLAWWGLGLIAVMRRGKRAEAGDAPAPAPRPAAQRPPRIEAGHFVTDVLEWFPQTAWVFQQHGFTMLKQPLLLRTLARGVTLRQAAGVRGVQLDDLLRALNDAAGLAAPAGPTVPLTVRGRTAAAVAGLVLLASLAPAALAQGVYEQDPINYSTAPSHDPVARLAAKIERGEVRLEPDPVSGYLPSLLKHLDVPVSSQTLVFSKTSFQRDRISPATPRALYFDDATYVGYVRGGDVLELASVDGQLGTVFYTLAQPKGGAAARPPRLVRQTHNCLQCHGSTMTRDVPGLLLRSVYPDRAGQPLLTAGTFLTSQESPLEKRWGGWYVTGTHGRQRHMGNWCVADENDPDKELEAGAGSNVTTLADRFDTSTYLSAYSDIVALMVMEHQAEVHNLITRAGYQTRLALRDEAAMNAVLGRGSGERSPGTAERIKAACEPLLRSMLFANEHLLTDPVKGTSPFAAEFEARGPRDRLGRSLREFDLERRLFKYPLSYLVYSEQFDALPQEAKDYLYRRLWDVLGGREDAGFDHLKRSTRRKIVEILRDTRPGLPAYWTGGTADD
jgi:hypothetical protein